MQAGIDAHRHADHQRQGRGEKAQLDRCRHLFEDDLSDGPRLLVREAELAARGPADKPRELNHEAVVEPEILPQSFAFGNARILPDHAVDRIADIVEQRKSDQRHGEHHENGLKQALNKKGDHLFAALDALTYPALRATALAISV